MNINSNNTIGPSEPKGVSLAAKFTRFALGIAVIGLLGHGSAAPIGLPLAPTLHAAERRAQVRNAENKKNFRLFQDL